MAEKYDILHSHHPPNKPFFFSFLVLLQQEEEMEFQNLNSPC